MHLNRSPPAMADSHTMGGSSAASPTTSSKSPTGSGSSNGGSSPPKRNQKLSPLQLGSQQQQLQSSSSAHHHCLAGSQTSLYSNSSTKALLAAGPNERNYYRQYYSHYSHSHAHHHHSRSAIVGGGNGGGSGAASGRHSSISSSGKRGKKPTSGNKRAGMSFLIVIAFFAVFGLIIITELFMIDERSHSNMVSLRHGSGSNYAGRMGDSMPDYDNAKDDYDLLGDSLLSDNKLGFIQFQDNKFKIQDADSKNDGGRLAGILLNSPSNGQMVVGGGGGGGGSLGSGSAIPWGRVLAPKVEETLPHFELNPPASDGSWQVVNGTRFKFFVFSAYYDRRDGSRLVRIIGATKTRGPERVFCRLWYANKNATSGADGTSPRGRGYSSTTVMARVKVIRENWNLKYSACFVLCPIRAADIEVPHYVSVVFRLRAPPGNLLQLRNTDWDADFVARAAAQTSGMPHMPPRSTAAGQMQNASSNPKTAAAPGRMRGGGPLPTGEQIADKIAICVKPFHFNYDKALYLMEYLEFYALLGVSHFTFYNHTIGPHATCVLQHYVDGNVPGNLTAWDEEVVVETAAAARTVTAKKEAVSPITTDPALPKASSNSSKSPQAPDTPPPSQGPTVKRRRYESPHYTRPTVNILPWNLRMRSQKEIRTEGLFAALNDCLYRTMYRYKYLALVDLDEFIVPRHTDTLGELINSLNTRFRQRNAGAYSFQNAFFYLQFADDALQWQQVMQASSPEIRATLVTQRKTRRRFKLHPQKQRSKYICKPEAIVEAGNHFVWEYAPGKGSINVPPTEAILQHYRVCEFGGNDCIKAPSVVDRTATKYANRLTARVEAVYNYLKKPCSLPDLPTPTQAPVKPTMPSQPIIYKKTNQEENETNKKETNQDKEPKHNDDKKGSKGTTTTISKAAGTGTAAAATAEGRGIAVKSTVNQQTSKDKVTEKEQEKDVLEAQQRPEPNNDPKKGQRKVVVFETDENGETSARLEYVE